MKPSSVYNSRSKLLGSEVSVKGYLKSNNITFLVETDSSKSNSENSIFLPHESTQELLLQFVPAYVGGPYLYSDKCEVRGILEIFSESNILGLLPREIKIFREETIVIKFQNEKKPDSSQNERLRLVRVFCAPV